MKATRIVLVIIILMLLGGCGQSKEPISSATSSIEDDAGETEAQRIKRIQEEFKAIENSSSHDYYSYEWREYSEGFICVPDRETAIQIASTVLRTNEVFDQYLVLYVEYDDVHEIWMVFFQHKDWFGEPGESIMVAIQKKDAQVLGVFWA